MTTPSMQPLHEAFRHCQAFLYSIPETIDAEDVRNVQEYTDMEVDLRWIRAKSRATNRDTELIKVCFSPEPSPDRYFVEILDCDEKCKPGWFSCSQATILFYYCLDARELHILLLKKFKPWLVQNMKKFKIQPCPSNDVLPISMGLGCSIRLADLPDSLQKTIVQVDMSDFT